MTETVEKAFGLTKEKKIKHLNVQEIFAGISKLEANGYGDAQNKPISIFIGATRCGKSTLINLFLDNPLIVKKDDDEKVPSLLRKIILVENQYSKGKFPVIGTKTTSETSVPMKYMLKDGGVIWDCPGFGDSRGPQQEIINAWFVCRLFKTSQGVKLFNLCSAQSLTDSPNVAEFRGYVQQIIDLFGEEKLSGIKQTLVFTKSEKSSSAEEIKETLLYLIKDHFQDQKAIFDFFNNAKVMKIDRATKEDIDKVLTKSDIPELNIAYEEMEYQPIMPHVGIDQGAQVFLHKSIEHLCKVAVDNMKNAYRKTYEATMTKKFQDIFQQYCTEKDLMKSSDQFITAKKECPKVVSNDLILLQESNLINEITDFVLKIINKDDLKCIYIKDMVKTPIQAVQYYNNNVMNYEFTISFFKFLKSNSNNITAKEKFHEKWDAQIKTLCKPKISDLLNEVTVLYEQAAKINVEINNLHEQGKLEAEKELIMEFNQSLKKNQEKYQKDMQNYSNELMKAIQPSNWAIIFASIASFIPGVKFIAVPLIHTVDNQTKSVPDAPELKNSEFKEVCTILDRSFADYLQDQPLLCDMSSYWDND